jgi:hypothetical protein
MRGQRLALVTAVLAATLAGCDFSINIGDDTETPLDQATAIIDIVASADSGSAEVTARVTGRFGGTVALTDTRAIFVNDQRLSGPNGRGEYVATIDGASSYVIRVAEPSRGIEETTVTAPAAFDVTSPTAGGPLSLSGATLAWGPADPTLDFEVEMQQTLFSALHRARFGPFPDAGSLTLSAENLRTFRQGADLIVTITRSQARSGLAGLQSATVTTAVSRTVIATPAP